MRYICDLGSFPEQACEVIIAVVKPFYPQQKNRRGETKNSQAHREMALNLAADESALSRYILSAG